MDFFLLISCALGSLSTDFSSTITLFSTTMSRSGSEDFSRFSAFPPLADLPLAESGSALAERRD